MKKLLTILLSLIAVHSFGQGTIKIPFATSPPAFGKYAWSPNGLWIDSAVKLPYYASPDTAKALAIDASGNMVNRTFPTQATLNLKLSIVDTPFMLAPYLKKRDSTLYVTQSQALNLVSYGSLTSTLTAYLLKADTPSMLAAYLPRRDSSIYSGYTTHYQVDSAVYKRFIASIEDFGADPTGILNSNLPIRQAIGTSKPIVLIPIGTYLMDDTAASPAYPQTTMKVGQTIIGLSRTASIIKTTVNTAMIGINVGCSGHDFTLRGSGVGKNDTGKRLQTGLVGVARSNVDFHDIILKCFSGGHDVNATGANNGGGLVLTNGDAVTRHRGVFYSIWADSCNVGVSVDNRSEYYSFTNTDITNSRIGIWLGAGNIDWTGGGVNANLYSFFINDKANSGNNGHCNFNGVKFNHNDSSIIDSTLIGMSFTNCTFYNGLTVGPSYFKIKNSVGIHFSGGDMSQQIFNLTNNKQISQTGVFEFTANTYNVISGESFSTVGAGLRSLKIASDTIKLNGLVKLSTIPPRLTTPDSVLVSYLNIISSISLPTLTDYLQAATPTKQGVITTTTQSFMGPKIFLESILASGVVIGAPGSDGISSLQVEGLKATIDSMRLRYMLTRINTGNDSIVVTDGSNCLKKARMFFEGGATVSATSYLVVVSDANHTIGCTNTAARAITLPDATTYPVRVPVFIKDEAGTALTGNITVTPLVGGQTIDGAANNVININYTVKGYYSNGTTWFTSY